MGLFDLDDSLIKEEKKPSNYDDDLRKAKVLCIRGEYGAALAIYNAILDKDFENEGALIGILRVHSKDFRELKGEQLDNDIHAIESLHPNTKDPDYLAYKQKRNGSSNSASTSSKPNNSLSDLINNIFGSEAKTETKKETVSKPAAPSKHDLFLKYKKEGDTAYNNKEPFKGIKSYEMAIPYAQNDEELISIYPRLAWLQYDIKETQKALDYMLKALRSGYMNNESYPYNYIGVCYYELEDWKNALKYFEMGVARFSLTKKEQYRLGRLYFNMGFCYYSLGNASDAVTYYEKAIASNDINDSTLSYAYNNAAVLYYYQNKGVTQNKIKGKEYTIKAAKLGHKSSIDRARKNGWSL